jgi:hypothetical protein
MSSPARARLVLRALRFMLVGGVLGSVLGLLMTLPAEWAGTTAGGNRAWWPIVWTVCAACGRLGALVGLIAFFVKRALTGEVADPRLAPRTSELG